ncbi:MAG TPA: DUF4232 domain-containing protein [Solirubrobacteraceae bacterium]|nr:DUF4232 domain-containing protein [Solirubrobacteraceae bacterium]
MRFSRLLFLATAAVIGALVVVACGGSSNTSDDSGSGSSTVTVTRTVTTPPPPPASSTTTGPLTSTTATKTTTTAFASGTACTASDLTPSFLGSNGAAGTVVLGFALKNTGSKTCHTYGWPGVEFLSAGDKPLPTDATRTTGDVVGSTPANALALKPGEEASFRIVASDVGTGGGGCATAKQLQIYAPDDTVTMKVSLPGVAACGKATVSPLLPGASAFAGQGGGGQGAAASSSNGGSGVSGSA